MKIFTTQINLIATNDTLFAIVSEKKLAVKVEVSEAEMANLGAQIASSAPLGGVFYLQGTLGMGKTTLPRTIVQGLGWSGHVKSPTYTLVESYLVADRVVYHFDLYRLADPEELEFIGIRDYDTERALWLVEWPEQGAGLLPQADIIITLQDSAACREITFDAQTAKGQHIIQRMTSLRELQ